MSDGQPFRGYTLILVLHLLHDAESFLDALLHLGADPDRIVVVNIPYSTKYDAVAAIWTRGISRLQLSTEYPIDDAVATAVAAAAEIARATGTKLLVIEDGGYVGPYLHRHQPELLPLVAGIVEQTQNGIWQYQADSLTGDSAVELLVPVLNVAESDLKKTLESPLIGRAVRKNVVGLVEDGVGISTEGLTTLIIGFGATGSEVARTFAKVQERPVRVFDVQGERRRQARQDKSGFEVYDDLESAIRGAQLIIGCTGRERIISMSALGAITGTCYFANGSSKRREMDWDALQDLQRSEIVLRGGVGRSVELPGGWLTVLADGFPVNFVGESVPNEEIAFVYGLLLRSALMICSSELEAGFIPIPDDLQAEIRADHFRLLGR